MPVPPLVGYLGTASSSKPYELGDISLTGFCLLTDERWIPGTEMPITLQTTNLPSEKDLDCFTVQATVVRCGKDGVGFSIVLCEEESRCSAWQSAAREMGNARGDGTVPATSQGATRVPELQEEGPIPAEPTAACPAGAQGRLKAAFEGGR